MVRPVFLCLLLVLTGSIAACAGAKPWERGRLAHDCMQVPVDAVEAAYRGHVEVVREASSGGTTAGGGGCGCN